MTEHSHRLLQLSNNQPCRFFVRVIPWCCDVTPGLPAEGKGFGRRSGTKPPSVKERFQNYAVIPEIIRHPHPLCAVRSLLGVLGQLLLQTELIFT